MRNIEIKAVLRDSDNAEAVVATLVAYKQPLVLGQTDTYFRIDNGRLKLREKTGDEVGAELIFYRRTDAAGPKYCHYEIIPVAEPQNLKALLAKELGVKTVVKKKRKIYLFENARIHLDEVEGLGSFLEIEVVMHSEASDEAGESLIQRLIEALRIDPENLLDCSYCDLMERRSEA